MRKFWISVVFAGIFMIAKANADTWTTGTSGQITSGTSTIARFRQNGTTKVIITNAGELGVGTASPLRTLDVSGTFRATAIEGNGVFPITSYRSIPNNTGTAY